MPKLYLMFALLIVGILSCKNSTGTATSDSDDSENSSDCKYDNGTHSATVDYYNPDTGYEATYNLDVKVSDCEVIQIDFNNGGWLDDSHISPTELDEEGNCTIDDDRGREFTVHVED